MTGLPNLLVVHVFWRNISRFGSPFTRQLFKLILQLRAWGWYLEHAAVDHWWSITFVVAGSIKIAGRVLPRVWAGQAQGAATKGDGAAGATGESREGLHGLHRRVQQGACSGNSVLHITLAWYECNYIMGTFQGIRSFILLVAWQARKVFEQRIYEHDVTKAEGKSVELHVRPALRA